MHSSNRRVPASGQARRVCDRGHWSHRACGAPATARATFCANPSSGTTRPVQGPICEATNGAIRWCTRSLDRCRKTTLLARLQSGIELFVLL